MAKRAESTNEGRICDAVIRLLEQDSGRERGQVRFPEQEGNAEGGVEVVFNLGEQQYALEHTLIEAFSGQKHFDATFAAFYEPIADQLQACVRGPGVYSLLFPTDTALGAKANNFAPFHAALLDWVRTEATALYEAAPERPDRDRYPHNLVQRKNGRPDGFPYDIILVRERHWSLSERHDGVLRPTRIAEGDIEEQRERRIQAGLRKKEQKLRFWRKRQARALLVLESGDIALTNHALVGERLESLLPERPDWLDDIFFVYTGMSTWSMVRWNWEHMWWEDGYFDCRPSELSNVTGS